LPLLGGFQLKFSVDLEELREPEHARLRARGKTFGAASPSTARSISLRTTAAGP
jgi:hypothetical protein